MEDFIKDQWTKEVSLDKDEYIEEIALMVVEKLVELNKDQNLDLIELLKNNVSVKVIPMQSVHSADEMVPEEQVELDEIMNMQKQIMDRVILELKKKKHTNMMN